MKYSLVVPVYKNEASIADLLQALIELDARLSCALEVVFVVDGSPDNSYALLNEALDGLPFSAQLLAHSRNFGSFPAIRSGLKAATGDYFAVMAADLQEPTSLVERFYELLSTNRCDVTIGTRETRNDPGFSRFSSAIFWKLYKRFVVPEMPDGGVDIFGCNKAFRSELLKLEESRSSLIALIFWLGFTREVVPYERLERQQGESAWTFGAKVSYMMDSVFAFTDLPIRFLMRLGMFGLFCSMMLGAVTVIARYMGAIDVSGYASLFIMILFFGALNLLGLGLVGTYSWRAYENTKQRPLAIVARQRSNPFVDEGNSND